MALSMEMYCILSSDIGTHLLVSPRITGLKLQDIQIVIRDMKQRKTDDTYMFYKCICKVRNGGIKHDVPFINVFHGFEGCVENIGQNKGSTEFC